MDGLQLSIPGDLPEQWNETQGRCFSFQGNVAGPESLYICFRRAFSFPLSFVSFSGIIFYSKRKER